MKIERMLLGPLRTNCYIIFDETSKEAAVVDPAGDFEKIKEKITVLNVKVKYIIITHAHDDHIGALDDLKDMTNAKICVGNGDADALRNPNLNLSAHFGANSPKYAADIYINDKDSIYLGDTKLEFITTPGHTKGGMCVYFEGVLICGDTLFFESVGRTDFANSSTAELIHSIKDKLFLLPDNTVLYPGHGDITTIGHEKTNNPFVW